MRKLHLDWETFSEADLKAVGAYRYAFDPSTEILCAAMALDDGEPVAWWQGMPRETSCAACDGLGTVGTKANHRDCHVCGGTGYLLAPIEDENCEYRRALLDPSVLIYAHNAQFEMAICQALLQRTWGIPCPDLSRFRCTMSLARRAALPGKLEKLAEVLELKNLKDKRGSALIKKFSIVQEPKKPTKANPAGFPRRRIRPEDEPEAFAEFVEYCKQDVRAEQDVARRLAYFDSEPNNSNYMLHERINARGVTVNLAALRHAQTLIDEETEIVSAAFRKLTGFEVTQGARLLEWLRAEGVVLENLQAETIETFLEQNPDVPCPQCLGRGMTHTDLDIEVEGVLSCPMCGGTGEPPVAVIALRMKQSIAYASIKKVHTMIECAGPGDNRIRGMLSFHGATTGRSTSQLVQLQNLKRSTIKGSEHAYQMICGGCSREELELCHGPVSEVISSCVRHFIHDTD